MKNKKNIIYDMADLRADKTILCCNLKFKFFYEVICPGGDRRNNFHLGGHFILCGVHNKKKIK
jgi:hypothetical protein